MPSNPNLAPVTITDKNGVSTTRWKRMEGTWDQSSDLPAPSPLATSGDNSQLQRAELFQQTPFSLMEFSYIWDSLEEECSQNDVIDRFLSLPADTQSHFLEVASRPEMSTIDTSMIFLKMLTRDADAQMIDDACTYLSQTDEDNLMFAERMFKPYTETAIQYQPIKIDITGLRQYRLPGFHYDRNKTIRQQDATTQEQIKAIFKLHSRYYYDLEYVAGEETSFRVTANNVIEPYWLAVYAAEHPENVDRLLDTVRERGTADEETIRPVLDNESPSLMNGVL